MQNVMLTHQDHEEEGSSAKRRKVLSPNEAPQEILLHNYISPARDGDANVVTQSLVNPAVDPNWIRFGWTPLLIAAANGREQPAANHAHAARVLQVHHPHLLRRGQEVGLVRGLAAELRAAA